MNDQQIELPEITAEAVDRIEHEVFAEIARGAAGRTAVSARRRTRRRRWMTGLGVAAAFAVGVLVTPPLLQVGNTTGVSGVSLSDAAGSSEWFGDSGRDGGGAADMAVPDSVALESAAVAAEGSAVAEREIIATGHATVVVADVAAAVEEIAALAAERGGYVESTSVSRPTDLAADEQRSSDDGRGWISIRIPSADLAAVVDALAETGTVVTSEISQHDVTMTAIDLRARVEALQASVARLTELMSESGSLSDLIDAEVALTDRQAELESYQQQLSALEDQVAMSSLQVSVTRQATAVPADPAGFADGLLAGWNGLVVSLNAVVIAIGFLLPWLVIAGAVVLVVWLIRRRRTAPEE